MGDIWVAVDGVAVEDIAGTIVETAKETEISIREIARHTETNEAENAKGTGGIVTAMAATAFAAVGRLRQLSAGAGHP